MFGVSQRDIDVARAWNGEGVVSFQSQSWFNENGNWNDIATKHFAGSEELEVDLSLDIDNKKLNACVVGNCAKGKEVKIRDFEVPSKGFVPYFSLYYAQQRLQCIKIPISWYGLPQKDLFTKKGIQADGKTPSDAYE